MVYVNPKSRRLLLLVPLGLGLAWVGLPSCRTVESPAVIDEAGLAAARTFDYADWSAVLGGVDDQGEVDYAALLEDRAALDRFVAVLGKVGPKTRPALFPTTEHALAYYLNAYNALTMFNVVNRYPAISSVTERRLEFFVTTRFPLDGEAVSLYDLENKIVRPTFRDPRVHFALNCASAGCPVLPGVHFEPTTLNAQLDEETRTFLHQPRNVSVEDGKIVLSEIFRWYAEDFPPDVLTWLRRTAPDLALPEGAEVIHRPYDWALNDQGR